MIELILKIILGIIFLRYISIPLSMKLIEFVVEFYNDIADKKRDVR